jgi:hypothetical protein
MVAHWDGGGGWQTTASHGFFCFYRRLSGSRYRDRARTGIAVVPVAFCSQSVNRPSANRRDGPKAWRTRGDNEYDNEGNFRDPPGEAARCAWHSGCLAKCGKRHFAQALSLYAGSRADQESGIPTEAQLCGALHGLCR